MTGAVTPVVHVEAPEAACEPCLARLTLRLAELAQDLALPRPPLLRLKASSGWSVRVGHAALRIPIGLEDGPDPAEGAAPQAERIFAALHRHRWELLAPRFAAASAEAQRHLRDASQLGLNLDDLHALAPVADHAADCAWAASERCGATVEVHAARQEDAETACRDAWSAVQRLVTLGLAPATAVADPSLETRQWRLRLRRVRTPVAQADEPQGAADALGALARRHGLALVDAPLVACWLLNPNASDLAQVKALAHHLRPDLPDLAAGLRQLMAENLPFPSPGALQEALQPRACRPAPASGVPVALPGTLLVSARAGQGPAPAVATLRAALIGTVLRQRAGAARRLPVWYVPPATAERLASQAQALRPALLTAVLPCARSRGIVLVPPGTAAAFYAWVGEELPDTLIVETAELPPSVQPDVRSVVDLPMQTPSTGVSP